MDRLEKLRQQLLSIKAYLDGLPTPAPTPLPPFQNYDWSTPETSRHSVRVICDEMGLTPTEKDLISQVIHAESGYNNKAKLENKKNGVTWSTDWGICQVNDWYHVGPGKKFSSVNQVLNNPDKCVKWMIAMYKQGRLSMWVAYSSKAYLRYTP